MTTFKETVSIPLTEARGEIDFNILRENLISEDSSIGAEKDAVIRADNSQPLGIISKKKHLLEYGNIMDRLTEDFTQSGYDFKLKESVITRKGDLYQEYIFDWNMENPDGEDLAPMIIAKASYIGKPLSLIFGTYRFVCLNGVVVGETLDSIEVKSREVRDLLTHTLKDEIRQNLLNMSNVSKRYADLASKSMVPYLNDTLVSSMVATGMKKKLLGKLQDEGSINIPMIDEGLKMTKEDFITDYPENLYVVREDKSAWKLYNDMTELSTHSSRSVNSKISSSYAVSNVFEI